MTPEQQQKYYRLTQQLGHLFIQMRQLEGKRALVLKALEELNDQVATPTPTSPEQPQESK